MRWARVEDPAVRDEALPELARAAARELGWSLEAGPDAAPRIHATPAGRGATRVWIARTPEGAVRVSSSANLPAREPGAARAMASFAREANTRLRRVRVEVTPAAGVVRITWQAVVPEGELARAVEEVAVARALTARELAALADETVRDAYQTLRDAAPGARTQCAEQVPAPGSGTRSRN